MMRRWFGVCVALALSVGALSRPAERKPLAAADYGKWENLGTGVLSPDGRWLAVPITRVDGTAELRLYSLADADSPGPSRPAFTAAQGHDPAFSRDSSWLAYRIGYSETEREKLEDDKKPVREKAAVVALGRDRAKLEAEVFADVSRLAFAEGGAYLALLRYPPEGSKRKGADLVVRDLAGVTGASF